MIHLHWHFFLTLIQLFSHDYFLFTQSIYFQMVFTQFIYLFFLNDSYLTCDFPPPHNSFLFTYRFVRFQMQFWKKNVRFIFIYLHNSFLFTCEFFFFFFLHNSSYLFYSHIGHVILFLTYYSIMSRVEILWQFQAIACLTAFF